MLEEFIRAIGLVLVIEGMLPFISPDGWRQAMAQAGKLPDKTLRTIGLVSMLIGVLIMYLIR